MTGVSYMIPFVAAGGLLIALGLPARRLRDRQAVQGHPRGQHPHRPAGPPAPSVSTHALSAPGQMAYLGAILFVIGKTAFAFFIPALAGYIAYAIADRPGIAPGFVMGGLAADVRGSPSAPADRLPRRASSAVSSPGS